MRGPPAPATRDPPSSIFDIFATFDIFKSLYSPLSQITFLAEGVPISQYITRSKIRMSPSQTVVVSPQTPVKAGLRTQFQCHMRY